MTVDRIKRSQSMWAMSPNQKNNAKATFQNHRSYSVLSASSINLAESPKSKSKFARKFRSKKDKKTNQQTTCYVMSPCLCGDVDAVDSQGRSLLFYAARYGQIETATQLLEAGCSPNQQDLLGNTPLHEAVEKHHLDVAEIFLQNENTDINLSAKNGDTPLMLAVTLGQIDAICLLHKYGADLNACDALGDPPIYRAFQKGWNEVAEFLLDNQCDVNTTAANGMTCFFAAAHNNKIACDGIARRLLKTDYNFKKDAGWLETEGCPVMLADDSKTHEKILQRSGLKASTRKPSFLSNGRKKLLKTLRSLSR